MGIFAAGEEGATHKFVGLMVKTFSRLAFYKLLVMMGH